VADSGAALPSKTGTSLADSTPAPAAGKGNITGAVLFDGKPVAGIDVKLCEKFSTLGISGCSGEIYTAKTDASGVYVVRDVAPRDYQGLLVRLFDADSWVYASGDILSARKYTIRPGTTIQADDSNLYKRDVFVLMPRAGSRVAAPAPEIRWAAYPGAGYYEITLEPEYILGESPDAEKPRYTRVRVDKTSFVPDKPLKPGRYGVQVDVHSLSKGNPKIAESLRKRVFIVVPAGSKELSERKEDAPVPAAHPSPPSFEVAKPTAGLGAVQGSVLFDETPVAGIEVKLCEKFDQHFSGCSGKIYTTKTDAQGVYLFKDVPPKEYEGLTARVFGTKDVIYVAGGIAGMDKRRYKVEADNTLVAPPTNLFKSDLRIGSPRAKAQVASSRFEVKWTSYPGAAYYTISIGVDYLEKGPKPKKLPPYNEFAVDDSSFMLDEPLENGAYVLNMAAYNAWGQKLADTAHGVRFSIAAK
jgi:hypothetical protein